jgi:hypothetical protein
MKGSIDDFVDFTGEENEKEFLEKCLKQWKISGNSNYSDIIKLCHIATIFVEIEMRLEGIED